MSRRPLQPGDWLTPAQALELLPHLSRASFYRLVDAGVIPAKRDPSVGGARGRVAVRRDALAAYMEALPDAAIEPPPTPPAGVDEETVDTILARVEAE